MADYPAPPLPAVRGNCKFNWRAMAVGDSFFVSGYMIESPRPPGFRRMGTSSARRMLPGSKWVMREVVEDGRQGVRVWRTA